MRHHGLLEEVSNDCNFSFGKKVYYEHRYLSLAQLKLSDCISIDKWGALAVRLHKESSYCSIQTLIQRLEEPISWWQFKKKRIHQEWHQIYEFAVLYYWIKMTPSVPIEYGFKREKLINPKENRIKRFFMHLFVPIRNRKISTTTFEVYKEKWTDDLLRRLHKLGWEQLKSLDKLPEVSLSRFELEKNRCRQNLKNCLNYYLRMLHISSQYPQLSDQQKRELNQHLKIVFNDFPLIKDLENNLKSITKHRSEYLQIILMPQPPKMRFNLRLNEKKKCYQATLQEEFSPTHAKIHDLSSLISEIFSEKEAKKRLDRFVDYKRFEIRLLHATTLDTLLACAKHHNQYQYTGYLLAYQEKKKALVKNCRFLRCFLHPDNLSKKQHNFRHKREESDSVSFNEKVRNLGQSSSKFIDKIMQSVNDKEHNILQNCSNFYYIVDLQDTLNELLDTGKKTKAEIFKLIIKWYQQQAENEARLEELQERDQQLERKEEQLRKDLAAESENIRKLKEEINSLKSQRDLLNQQGESDEEVVSTSSVTNTSNSSFFLPASSDTRPEDESEKKQSLPEYDFSFGYYAVAFR